MADYDTMSNVLFSSYFRGRLLPLNNTQYSIMFSCLHYWECIDSWFIHVDLETIGLGFRRLNNDVICCYNCNSIISRLVVCLFSRFGWTRLCHRYRLKHTWLILLLEVYVVNMLGQVDPVPQSCGICTWLPHMIPGVEPLDVTFRGRVFPLVFTSFLLTYTILFASSSLSG